MNLEINATTFSVVYHPSPPLSPVHPFIVYKLIHISLNAIESFNLVNLNTAEHLH